MATQWRSLRVTGGQPVDCNILHINHSQIPKVSSEIQASKVTDGNIISICVVNVSICIHLDYRTTKAFIVVGVCCSWYTLIDLLVCTCAGWQSQWSLFETSVELKVLQHEPRKITRLLDGTFSEFKTGWVNSSTTALPPFCSANILLRPLEGLLLVYYEWRACSSAFPKWIGLTVNGLWWFIWAYTRH